MKMVCKGILCLALLLSTLASAEQKANNNWLIVSYAINISEKGKQIIEAWKSGDRSRLKQTLGGPVPGLDADGNLPGRSNK